MPAQRRILLAVTGLSPQVMTETLYALAVQERWIPDEIHLITTVEGATRARLTLLSDDPGWFHRLRQEYALPAIHFDAACIHPMADANGQALSDIRSPADNEAAADAITDIVRELTVDPASTIHASIAGGRKTMGFYLGYAMSLFGRAQDRLSHVLVSSPFESNQGFYYPSKTSRVIYGPPPDNRPLDTRDAVITLADIPFVRLRDGLNDAIRQGRARFSEAVAQAQKALRPPCLVLDVQSRWVCCGEIALRLAPRNFALLLLLAQRVKAGQRGVSRSQATTIDQAEFLAIYNDLPGALDKSARKIVRNGLESERLQETVSRLNRQLKETLGSGIANPYLVQAVGPRSRAKYELLLKPEQIQFDAIEK